MNLDDPKLTAFALNELDEPEKPTITRAVAESPEAQRVVDETRELAQMLKVEYATDREKQPVSPANLIDIRDDPWLWSIARPLAIAAVITLCAVIGADGGLTGYGGGLARKQRTFRISQENPFRSSDVEGQIELAPETAGDRAGSFPGIRRLGGESQTGIAGPIGENQFLDAKSNPLSTFPIAVDTASYSNICRFINAGLPPPKDAVRIEEMINYFSYDYSPPTDEKAFALYVDLAGCPWEPAHRLVRVGLKGGGNPVTIAKDVKVLVEFNPARVASYRLIGFEDRTRRKDVSENKVNENEVRAGYTVTALYEVVPGGVNERSTSSEMLTVKLHYKKPSGDKNELIERSLIDESRDFAKAPADLKFAAAVAEFGMLLRDSEHKGSGTLGAVLEWAQEGKGADPNGYRAGFIELVRKAQTLRKG